MKSFKFYKLFTYGTYVTYKSLGISVYHSFTEITLSMSKIIKTTNRIERTVLPYFGYNEQIYKLYPYYYTEINEYYFTHITSCLGLDGRV